MEGDVIKVKMWVAQSCPSLCDPMDCGPSGSSIHGIFQARIVKWVAISLSRDLPNAGIEPKSLMSPALSGEFFTTSTTWEAQSNSYANIYSICFLGLLSMHLFAQIVLFLYPLWINTLQISWWIRQILSMSLWNTHSPGGIYFRSIVIWFKWKVVQ